MNWYGLNYDSLVKYDSDLARRLAECKRDFEVERLVSKAGLPTARIKHNSNRPVLLHSLYDPEKEARRVVEKITPKKKNLIIILGFGLGYYSLEILKRNPLAYLVIIERHPSLFKVAMEFLDLRPLFSSRRAILLLTPDDEGLKRDLTPLFRRLLNIKHQFFLHPSAHQLDGRYYQHIMEVIDSGWNLDAEESCCFDEATNYYKNLPAGAVSYSPGFQQKILQRFVLKTGLDSEARVLDLCSGGGRNIHTLLSFFSGVVAMDISREALTKSRMATNYGDLRLLRVHYEVGDAHSIPFGGDFFDLVVCTEALQLIPDSSRVIKEIGRVLSRDGFFIMSTPSYTNPMGRLKRKQDKKIGFQRWNPWGINKGGGFEKHFSSWALEGMLKEDFKIVETSGADYILPWLFWIPKIKNLVVHHGSYPLLELGRIPGLKRLGMHYYILAKRK